MDCRLTPHCWLEQLVPVPEMRKTATAGWSQNYPSKSNKAYQSRGDFESFSSLVRMFGS